ncbi:MUP1 High-affinity methionine permease [Candida maltosa Xu316]|uniref:High-affinity methionine permease n=1 Tax=Candida maltosa (strain Xu316) TaxID=1245528 RepID=M3K2L6_CANMX|nr:High-affinity methionine permease [Candida maltosa Xu316]
MGFSDIYKSVTSPHTEKQSETTADNVSNYESSGSEIDAEVQLDKNVKQIGVLSATFLIINRCIGAGIFATGASIYNFSGSVGGSLMFWVAGTIIAFSGLLVYMELGSALPRNGSEVVYLQHIYKKPNLLVISCYAVYALTMPWTAGNSIVTGEYILTAAGKEVTQWNSRGIALAVVTFAFLVNAINAKVGLYIANTLGSFKIIIILFIIITGWVGLGNGIKSKNFHPTHNFSNAFEGTSPTGYGAVNALYNVIWSFVGYSNASYALGEIKNPHKVLKIAAPAAFWGIAIAYMLVNIAYYAVVPVDVISASKRILVSDFFFYAFGTNASKAASVFVALSAWGNVMSVIFSQGRIITQLGRSGVIPFSRFFGSSKPFNTPFTGLLEHWIIGVIFICAVPPGDSYNFILNLVSYPLNVINTLLGAGLTYVYIRRWQGKYEWHAPIKATLPVTVFFFLSSLYLVVAPYIPPVDGQSVYESLPYWLHAVVTWGIFGLGGIFWVVWTQVLPKFGGYKLVEKEVLGEDGFWRNKIYKVSKDSTEAEIEEQIETQNATDSELKQ